MKSPFPGMDPWLEGYWGDIHVKLIAGICDRLNPRIPGRLVARAEQYVRLVAEGEDPQRFKPDIAVDEAPWSGPEAVWSPTQGGVAVAEPKIVLETRVRQKRRRIAILDAEAGGRLVTTIEVLSGFNKDSLKERRQFRSKQSKLLEAGVNIVEIDLLRRGRSNLPVNGPRSTRWPSTYSVAVVRAENPQRMELYPIALLQPLPNVRIPLRNTDPDTTLNLQELIEAVYINGAYDRTLTYRGEPVPPWNEAERGAVESVLKTRVS